MCSVEQGASTNSEEVFCLPHEQYDVDKVETITEDNDISFRVWAFILETRVQI